MKLKKIFVTCSIISSVVSLLLFIISSKSQGYIDFFVESFNMYPMDFNIFIYLISFVIILLSFTMIKDKKILIINIISFLIVLILIIFSVIVIFLGNLFQFT